MASSALLDRAKQEAWSDEQVVDRILDGETALYELLMRRYNQRLQKYKYLSPVIRPVAAFS